MELPLNFQTIALHKSIIFVKKTKEMHTIQPCFFHCAIIPFLHF